LPRGFVWIVVNHFLSQAPRRGSYPPPVPPKHLTGSAGPAVHGEKRQLMAPEGQLMAENDSSWKVLTGALMFKKIFKKPNAFQND